MFWKDGYFSRLELKKLDWINFWYCKKVRDITYRHASNRKKHEFIQVCIIHIYIYIQCTHIQLKALHCLPSVVIHLCSNYRISADVDINEFSMDQNSKIPRQQQNSWHYYYTSDNSYFFLGLAESHYAHLQKESSKKPPSSADSSSIAPCFPKSQLGWSS